MADGLEDLLRACTVRVTGGPMPGAGFFVAPGQILTCLHVIGDSSTLTVRWERDGRPALEVPVLRRVAALAGGGRPIPALAWDYPDIAVLGVAGLDGHPCVSIDPEWPSQEDTFQVFGYPREGGAVLLTPAKLSYRGTKGTSPGTFLDLASDRIKGGMSGAAVLNQRTGGVCGVLVASKDTACPDGALAIPWSEIDTELGPVLAASRAFHGTDPRWHAAAAARRQHLRFRLPWVVGVGKTQLAAAYVAAHRDEYDIAAWIRAEDGGIADLADLAVALALPVADRTPPERASDVLAFLADTERSWLLVLDNVPGPAALTGLPTSAGGARGVLGLGGSGGRVLVTSRHRGGYGAFGAELSVDVFDPATAREYLLARTGRTGAEAADAETVAQALGFLPLALAHAGAYCAADAGVPFGAYLELLADLPSQELFDTNPEIFYQHTVAATWNTSITAAGPQARQALEMAAFGAPEAIPRALFSVLAEDSAAGRRGIADALATLHRYSLATVADNRVTVHRLLQKVIRDRLTGPEQAAAIDHALTAVEQAMPEDPELPATWPQWQELVPHVIALAAHDAIATLDAQRLVWLVNQTCWFLRAAGFTLSAVDLATTAVAVSTHHLGPDHPGALAARTVLGASYWSAGRTADAITIQQQVIAGRERILGPDHPRTLTAQNNLASSYQSAGHIAEAITIQEQVAAEVERALGPYHPSTVIVRRNLAKLKAQRDADS